MCEEAPGVINTAFIYYDHQDDHQPDLCLIIITIIIITITTLDIQVCTHLLIFASIFLVVVTLPLSLCLIIKVIFGSNQICLYNSRMSVPKHLLVLFDLIIHLFNFSSRSSMCASTSSFQLCFSLTPSSTDSLSLLLSSLLNLFLHKGCPRLRASGDIQTRANPWWWCKVGLPILTS